MVKQRVRRENCFLEIVLGEGVRSVQLGKSSSSEMEPAGSIALEFWCRESRERLQEERLPGCTLPREFRRRLESCCKRLRDNKKLD